MVLSSGEIHERTDGSPANSASVMHTAEEHNKLSEQFNPDFIKL